MSLVDIIPWGKTERLRIIFALYVSDHIDSLLQDCSSFIANALELLQSCVKPSIFCCTIHVAHPNDHEHAFVGISLCLVQLNYTHVHYVRIIYNLRPYHSLKGNIVFRIELHVFAVMWFIPTLSGGIQNEANMCECVGWGIFWSYKNR